MRSWPRSPAKPLPRADSSVSSRPHTLDPGERAGESGVRDNTLHKETGNGTRRFGRLARHGRLGPDGPHAAENDFAHFEPLFFSTSNAGGQAPAQAKNETKLQDAFDIDALKRCDIIITCQGGDYTTEVFPKLRAAGWNGHWIDAASTLRMKDDAVIVLDPVNLPVIKDALAKGGSNWIGGNCTVSCMLMGVGALYKAGWSSGCPPRPTRPPPAAAPSTCASC
jgi:hypothetical protein